jgi:hypothetical protein
MGGITDKTFRAGNSPKSGDSGSEVGVEEIRTLVNLALSDPEIAQQARQAGLDNSDLLRVVEVHAAELARVATEQRAALSAADQEQEKARAARAVAKTSTPFSFMSLLALLGTSGGVVVALVDQLLLGVLLASGSFAALLASAFGVQRRAAQIERLDSLVSQAELNVSGAQNALVRARLEGSVKPWIRDELNARSSERWRLEMGPVDATGLTETFDARYLIATEARAQLDRMLDTGSGASIGLSGPRGAGKSSLIRALCPVTDEPGSETLGVVVSAPVVFETRDFLLHLSAEVCRAILGTQAVDRLRRPGLRRRTRPAQLWPVLSLSALGIAAIGLAELLFITTKGISARHAEAIGLSVLGLGSLGAAWIAWNNMRRRGFDPRELLSSSLQLTAAQHLEDIWFQQSFTSGWSGQVQLPLGIQGGLEGGRELARQQLSVPDLVGDLRRLIERLREEKIQLRIGIDELDKIESPKKAERFVNEIKVLFGIKNCYFLVSVSEDALSSFERRGMPLRDAIDSSFDDVVLVDYFRAGRTVQLLEGRTIRLPVPFMLLAHALGAGLPRDVIRIARDVVALAPSDSEESSVGLAEIASTIVAEQVSAKARALTTLLSRLPIDPEVDELRALVYDTARGRAAADVLQRFSSSARPAASDHEKAGSLREEFSAFVHFALTTLACFSDSTLTADERRLYQVANELAEARQALGISPELSRRATDEVRGRISRTVQMQQLDAG